MQWPIEHDLYGGMKRKNDENVTQVGNKYKVFFKFCGLENMVLVQNIKN